MRIRSLAELTVGAWMIVFCTTKYIIYTKEMRVGTNWNCGLALIGYCGWALIGKEGEHQLEMWVGINWECAWATIGIFGWH